MHICIGNLTTIDSDNGLSPGRRQAIIWTNDGTLLIGFFGTNHTENLIQIDIFSFKKIENVVWKMMAIFYQTQCVNWLPPKKRFILIIVSYEIRHTVVSHPDLRPCLN